MRRALRVEGRIRSARRVHLANFWKSSKLRNLSAWENDREPVEDEAVMPTDPGLRESAREGMPKLVLFDVEPCASAPTRLCEWWGGERDDDLAAFSRRVHVDEWRAAPGERDEGQGECRECAESDHRGVRRSREPDRRSCSIKECG